MTLYFRDIYFLIFSCYLCPPPPPPSKGGWGHIFFVQILLVTAVSVGLRVTAQDISKASRWALTWPQGYKRFFMLNPTKHEISTACISHKGLNWKIKTFLAFKLSDAVFIMLINVRMLTIVGILALNEHDKFHAQLSWAWKKFYNPIQVEFAYVNHLGMLNVTNGSKLPILSQNMVFGTISKDFCRIDFNKVLHVYDMIEPMMGGWLLLCALDTIFNPFKSNENGYPYQFDSPISNFRGIRWYFFIFSKF